MSSIEIESIKKLNITNDDLLVLYMKKQNYSAEDLKKFRNQLKNVIPDEVPIIIAFDDMELGTVDKDQLIKMASKSGDKISL